MTTAINSEFLIFVTIVAFVVQKQTLLFLLFHPQVTRGNKRVLTCTLSVSAKSVNRLHFFIKAKYVHKCLFFYRNIICRQNILRFGIKGQRASKERKKKQQGT